MERNGRFAGFFAKKRIWAPAATVDGDDGETDCGYEDEQTANDDVRDVFVSKMMLHSLVCA